MDFRVAIQKICRWALAEFILCFFQKLVLQPGQVSIEITHVSLGSDFDSKVPMTCYRIYDWVQLSSFSLAWSSICLSEVPKSGSPEGLRRRPPKSTGIASFVDRLSGFALACMHFLAIGIYQIQSIFRKIALPSCNTAGSPEVTSYRIEMAISSSCRLRLADRGEIFWDVWFAIGSEGPVI